MPGFVHFLRCVGKAALKHGFRALAGLVPMGDVVYEIACDAWGDYLGEKKDAELRAELQALAQSSPADTRQVAEQVAREVAAGQPPEVQVALTSYLSQVPAAVRQSLRRPADPTGTTVPPALALNKPEALLPFLPARMPRFKPGDCPPGVGDWELVELLGIGGFGEVWKARHATLTSRKAVALKFCLDNAAASALRNEAQLLDRVMQHGRHPGIVPLLQTYLSAEPPCLEYEYVEGGDLAGLMQEQMARGGAQAQFTAQIIHRLAKTVAFAHRLSPPIVHRDLKPSNILVQRKPSGKVTLLIADFGIGGVTAAQAISAYTPPYASPQQRRGEKPDPRDDVYALGVIWHQLLAGDLTADRPGGHGWRKKLLGRGMVQELIDLLEACIDDDADERPANAIDLVERIDKLLIPATLTPPSPISPINTPQQTKSPTLEYSSFPSELDRILEDIVRKQELQELEGPECWKDSSLPREIVNSLRMKLVLVPRGLFWMGASHSCYEKRIPHDFYIGAFPVTQGQWQAIMGNNPSRFSRGGEDAEKVKDVSDADLYQFPVEILGGIVYGYDAEYDVVEFLKRLNLREKDNGFLYRLPTEEEWECACRGGPIVHATRLSGTSDFYFTEPTDDLSSEQANFNGNYPAGGAPKGKYLERTTKVGSYKPNRLGIYDMHGNVWELCEGLYGPETYVVDVIRGGCWGSSGAECRASCRQPYEALKGEDSVGFRVAAIRSGAQPGPPS